LHRIAALKGRGGILFWLKSLQSDFAHRAMPMLRCEIDKVHCENPDQASIAAQYSERLK
jgi:hypothetical protein